ncbi:glycosyl transferase family A [Halobacteriales archaeon QH_7_65_31]|nr:MAG: glycosyl transferase family A [Halobacteriales archaeon QH_7_65_31]
MQVSVVVCTHEPDRYTDLRAAADSVLAGTYDDVELVLVSDGSARVTELLNRDYGDHPDARIASLDENQGLLVARNRGAAVATGDLIAFIDDDAIAAPDWLERLVAAHEARDRRATGGRMIPRWIADEPSFLPEEFYFLIGAAHRGFGPDGDREREGEIRNGMGSNLAVRAETFDALGGFEPTVGGREGDKQLQGGETELCIRLAAEFDEGVWYVPDAVVEHKIYPYRTEPGWLLKRAFWQGVSKRGMARFVPESSGDETAFLGRLVGAYLPDRVRGLLADPTSAKLQQLVMLLALTLVTGLGYLYGFVHWRTTGFDSGSGDN